MMSTGGTKTSYTEMITPGCPGCGRALVAVGLLAPHMMVYTCPSCKAWFDSSLHAIAAPL
jgi:hypothetical protein